MQVGKNLGAIYQISQAQNVSANNIANINTNDFKASRALQGTDRVQISPEARLAAQNPAGENLSTTDANQDLVQMTSNKLALSANIAVIQTQDEMNKALLDTTK
ncbi:MAG: hypothetical protein R8K49_09655 [Mariprofundaceae bacterium]